MKAVERILGEAKVRPPTKRELKDPHLALCYATKVIKGRWPEGEATIAKSPISAHYYARYVIKGRFPEAEATIAKDPRWACYYATKVIKGRWPEAEATIAKSEFKSEYLEEFPEAKDEWLLNGWIDWLDT